MGRWERASARIASTLARVFCAEGAMMLNQTIQQLDRSDLSPARARALAHLGYMQWLGSLPGNSSYPDEAMRAYMAAQPRAWRAPALAVFCDLLVASTRTPLAPLTLILPPRSRRGGARGRRAAH
jgi:hypothetical protein